MEASSTSILMSTLGKELFQLKKQYFKKCLIKYIHKYFKSLFMRIDNLKYLILPTLWLLIYFLKKNIL